MAVDTKTPNDSKPAHGEGIKLHKRLAMGQDAETGAGKGPFGGGNTGKKTPA